MPKAKTTACVSALDLQTSPAAQVYQPQLAVAEAGGNGHQRFAEPVISVTPPLPEPFDFDSSIDENDFIEEVEVGQKLSYADLEISLDPAEEEFDHATEPELLPDLSVAPAQQPIEIYEAHEAQSERPPFAETNEQAVGMQEAEVFHFSEPTADEATDSPPLDGSRDYEQDEATHQAYQVPDETQEIPALQAEADGYASAIDPWDDPLPAWDQSRREWPVMLAPEKGSTAKKLHAAVGVALIIAIGVAAYFLFFQRPGETAQSRQASATEKPPVAASMPTAEKEKAASEPTAPQTLAPAEAKTETAAADNETTAPLSEGRFTLQLASMPDQAAANEMAERLTSNGLPAYVASADLGSRGVWYRVRVGRFVSAEEAKRFAAKSRLEARVERNDN